ncbi:hypothetical protein BZG36_02417 [Bifiguratus adelaidae]|uniref:Palmitoyltransferase n=1 Tax=Bifiguratus adelaidae TaxID=1938954 RepID=A0A261Y1C1_9FUNG|nr:hypothetical protein BZG36_02417 [Bifiguratus adelaidae]
MASEPEGPIGPGALGPKIVAIFMPLLVCGLLGYTYYVFVARVCVNLLWQRLNLFGQAVAYMVISSITLLYVLWCYVKVVSTKPGSPLQPEPGLFHRPHHTNPTERDIHSTLPPPSRLEAGAHHVIPTGYSPGTYGDIKKPRIQKSQEKSRIDAQQLPLNTSDISDRTVTPTSSIENTPSNSLDDPFVLMCQPNGHPRYCPTCEVIKPDRCHHCRECGRCVLKMDHHCPWISGCVGHHNYKFFYLFIFSTVIHAVFILIATLASVVPILRYQPLLIDYQWVPLIALAALFTLLLACFIGIHTYYIFTNKTTIEAIGDRQLFYRIDTRPAKVALSNAVNPHQPSGILSGMAYAIVVGWPKERTWNLGWRDNWCSMMGYDWWAWFLPINNIPGDGITYPYNPTVYARITREAANQLSMPPLIPAQPSQSTHTPPPSTMPQTAS